MGLLLQESLEMEELPASTMTNQPTPPRRRLLALVLASRNWSCEQRGNVLIVHPYPAEGAEFPR